jgi:hypothetical protein
MSMKNIFRGITVLGALAGVTAANADMGYCWEPYVGLEYKYQIMKGKDDWSKVLPKNFHNLGIFVGDRFMKNVGVELGYERSLRKTKDASFAVTDTFFGGNPGAATTTSAKVRLSSFHLDLMGYMPLGDDDFELIGTIGLASAKPKVDISNNPTTGFETVSGKRKTLPRIGFGAQYQEEGSMFGVRGLVRWEGTSRLRANLGTLTNTFPNASTKIYKSGVSLAVAGFVSF